MSFGFCGFPWLKGWQATIGTVGVQEQPVDPIGCCYEVITITPFSQMQSAISCIVCIKCCIAIQYVKV